MHNGLVYKKLGIKQYLLEDKEKLSGQDHRNISPMIHSLRATSKLANFLFILSFTAFSNVFKPLEIIVAED